jgi:hypothetical protein
VFLTDAEVQQMTGIARPERRIRIPRYHQIVSPRGVDIQMEGFRPNSIEASALPLDQLRALPSGEAPWEPGVYFLWSLAELLYVGQSRYLLERLSRHVRVRDGILRGKAIPFTHWTYLLAAEDEIDSLESVYIRGYLPPFNEKVPHVVID